jgi:hypothetical protein
MAYTLYQCASIIRKRIMPYIGNANISNRQIEDEVIMHKNALLFEARNIMTEADAQYLIAEINCIPVECKDISFCCKDKSDERVYVASIPQLSSVTRLPALSYVGTIDQQYPYRIVTREAYLYVNYAKWTKRMPTAWYRQNLNEGNLVLFNLGFEPEVISIRGVVQNEQDLKKFSCACTDDDTLVYAPDWILTKVIDAVTERYMSQYQLSHIQPNTQSEILKAKT